MYNKVTKEITGYVSEGVTFEWSSVEELAATTISPVFDGDSLPLSCLSFVVVDHRSCPVQKIHSLLEKNGVERRIVDV